MLARIRHVVGSADGTQQVWVQGLERVRVAEFLDVEPYLMVRVKRIAERHAPTSPEVDALARNALDLFARLVSLSPFVPDELVNRAMNQDSQWSLLYLIASSLRLNVSERLELLEMDGLRPKYERLLTLLEREIDLLELGQKLRGQVQERVEKGQREFFLREQLNAIRKELGEDDPQQAELAELRDKIAAVPLPDEARKEAERELSRLERIPTASPEHSVIRTYLDWLIAIPWGTYTSVGHRCQPRPTGAGRGPLRARQDQGAHSRIPGRQEAARRAWRRRSHPRADPVPRRTAGRGQDEPRAVDSPRDGPEVRAALAGRCAR